MLADHVAIRTSTMQFINNIVSEGTTNGAIDTDSATATDAVFWYNDVWNNVGGNYTEVSQILQETTVTSLQIPFPRIHR